MATKRSEYEATARTRAQLRAQAQLNGWEVLDVLGAYVTPDGECIVLTKDGRRYGVTIPAPPVGFPVVEKKAVKVYAPRSWDPAQWNSNVQIIREQAMSKQSVIDNLAEVAQKQNTPEAHKRVRHAQAVIDALPDVPDWYELLPLAEIKD